MLTELARLAPLPANEEALTAWSTRFEAALNADGRRGHFVAELRLSGEGPQLQVTRSIHGNSQIVVFNDDFFAGADYQRIAALRARINGLQADGLQVRRGERSKSVACFDERSEERRVGKECVSRCRSRGSPQHYKTTTS